VKRAVKAFYQCAAAGPSVVGLARCTLEMGHEGHHVDQVRREGWSKELAEYPRYRPFQVLYGKKVYWRK